MQVVRHLLTFFLAIHSASAQSFYLHTYGSKKNPPVVYIHGGPRGNATLFEGTAAQVLADQGFYVIAYDRRGEGRSVDPAATFTFQEAFNDLNGFLQQLELKKVNIIGHSFGGIVATLYADKYPEKVNRLLLVGALFSQQETYNHILKSVNLLAKEKQDKETLLKIETISKLDKNSADYRKQCYEVASEYGYFRMPHPTKEYEKLYADYSRSEFGKNNIRNDSAPLLFYQNEKRVNIDTKPVLKRLKAKGVKLYALYGRQDRIFSESQLKDMSQITGKQRFAEIDNCSHYPFVDQRETCIQILSKWLKS